jgi:hypothetical protein
VRAHPMSHCTQRPNSFTPGLDTLVHIVPIGAAQLIDYGTDLISLFIFHHTEGLHVHSYSSPLVLAIGYSSRSGRRGGSCSSKVDNRSASTRLRYGLWNRSLIIALVPFNLHNLSTGATLRARTRQPS